MKIQQVRKQGKWETLPVSITSDLQKDKCGILGNGIRREDKSVSLYSLTYSKIPQSGTQLNLTRKLEYLSWI